MQAHLDIIIGIFLKNLPKSLSELCDSHGMQRVKNCGSMTLKAVVVGNRKH